MLQKWTVYINSYLVAAIKKILTFMQVNKIQNHKFGFPAAYIVLRRHLNKKKSIKISENLNMSHFFRISI
jgi:hypothetical protein